MPSMIPEDPNQQAIKLFRVLKILTVSQVCLSIFTMFINISNGFMMLIGAVVLYMVYCGRNFCMSIMYIILCISDMISIALVVGYYFTTHTRIQRNDELYLAAIMLKIPFYVISVYYAFLTYRELKAITLEIIHGSAPSISSPPPSSVNYFTGPGYVIGRN
jgi:hypothetical protein